MDRFARALDAPDANRVDARLAIARLMVRYGQDDDAKQQISLAFAESRIGEAPPVTADNLIEAANLLLAMHDFDLADSLFPESAGQAGAVARRRRHRIGEHLPGAGQDQAGRRRTRNDSAPIRLPIRTMTTCWRKVRCIANVTRAGTR